MVLPFGLLFGTDMAEPYVIRDTRQIMPLRGIGGYIGFLWWN